jgi:hypothetical protein
MVKIVRQLDLPLPANDENSGHLHCILASRRRFHFVAFLARAGNSFPHLGVEKSLEQVAAFQAISLVSPSIRVCKAEQARSILLRKQGRRSRGSLHDYGNP